MSDHNYKVWGIFLQAVMEDSFNRSSTKSWEMQGRKNPETHSHELMRDDIDGRTVQESVEYAVVKSGRKRDGTKHN